MKVLINELKQFIKDDFNLPAYAVTIIFVSTTLTLNYTLNIEKTIVWKYSSESYFALIYFVYYAIPYYLILFLSLYFKNHLHRIKHKEFWIKSIIFIAVFSFATSSKYYIVITEWYDFTVDENNYILKIARNLKKLLPVLLVVFIVSRFYDKNSYIYGFKVKNTHYRTYFSMLLFIIPLVVIASFTNDFQVKYPRFKYWEYIDVFGWEIWQKIAVFELSYGVDFISIELIFRGAMIIGLAKFLKKDAILPITAFYVTIHFGKPALEAISSFFGGFILGVHSYYTKQIFGGLIIHIGLAWMMEIAANFQHLFC